MVSANGSASWSQCTARIADVSGALTGVSLPVANQSPVHELVHVVEVGDIASVVTQTTLGINRVGTQAEPLYQ
jgi:hypothetical protein